LSEAERVGGQQANHIIDPKAPSAARVVFDHFGGVERFPNVPTAMMTAVDKADSADYDINDTAGESFELNASAAQKAGTLAGTVRVISLAQGSMPGK
jgi:hypothetical protein